MPEVRANGIRLYYEEHGSGTPILAMHGSGSSALMWAAAVEPLSRLGRLILYDRRGHTRSEEPDPFTAMTRDEEADDAAALLDALDAAPAIAIGRSRGAELALVLAHRRSDYVRAVAALEPGLFYLDPEAKAWEDELNARVRAAPADKVGETLIEEAVGAGTWASLPAEVREMFTANGPAILAEIEGERADLDEAALAAISQPTLLVSSEESPEEFRRVTDRLAALLPNAEELRVAGGHIIDPAHPDILRFVERFVD
jgi:pimeloyl-ACP methyl ester carboxylesterase